MIDDESLQMYVEESREHLEDIENDLLAIEEAGENIDEELVNKVFRAAHSMKGGAGFLGLTQIKELAHKIENVLDMIRNRQLVPTPEIVNIILLSFDRLREMIENISESNEMDISEHVDALVSITSGNLPAGEEKSVKNEIEITDSSGRPIFTVKEFDLLQARKGGKFVYLIEFDLIHDIHRKDKNPLDVINDMQATGQIIDVKLDLDAVGTLEDDIISNKIPMYVLYSTIIEPDIITLAKGLGGGIPIGAMVTKLKDGFEAGDHGSTFGGNYLSTSVALKVLEILENEYSNGKLALKIEYFKSKLKALQKKFPDIILEITGLGLMIGLKINSKFELGKIIELGHKHEILTLKSGNNILRFLPPLTISENEINQGFSRLEKVFQELNN